MAKKIKHKKKPIPSHVRVRMYRERKKLKQMRQNQLYSEQNDSNSRSVSNDSANSNNGLDNSTASNKADSLKSKLRNWANSFRVSKRAIDGLLAILNSSEIDSLGQLPKNHRTLLGTPVNIEIEEIAGGQLWYNGLEKCLIQIFSALDRNISISLNFNIDGLPLYNSSKISFWPILASIYGMCLFAFNIQLINIYCFS